MRHLGAEAGGRQCVVMHGEIAGLDHVVVLRTGWRGDGQAKQQQGGQTVDVKGGSHGRVPPGGGSRQRVRASSLRHGPLSPAGRSEEHTSELQSLMRISYAVFCLKQNTHQMYIETP